MSATAPAPDPRQLQLKLRRVEIVMQEGRYIARLLFLSRFRSDERTIGPFNDLDDVLELIRRIKFAVETLGKRAGQVS